MTAQMLNAEKKVLAGCCVVLIEPASEMVRAISQSLGDNGAATALLSTVPLAVTLLADKPGWADVLLVGPSVHPEDCKELVSSIREHLGITRKALPIFLVAPFRDTSTADVVLPHLFDAHIPLPTDTRQLIGAIQRVLAENARTER